MKLASRRPCGYALIEIVIALALTLVVTGTVFALSGSAHDISAVQSDAMDLQQRARVASSTLWGDLIAAGAGPSFGSAAGPLIGSFAPVLPRRIGAQGAEPASIARTDEVSFLLVPSAMPQTTLTTPVGAGTVQMGVFSGAGCPTGQPACGLQAGTVVLLFDSTGTFDVAAITQVQATTANIQPRGLLAHTYPPGTTVVPVETHTYYFDAVNLQLRHYDGAQTDAPVVDDVVGMTIRYFGDPSPPVAPKPPAGVANCLYDSAGAWQPLATLSPGSGSLVELPVSLFSDGPWCGSGANQFDADLLRVRSVQITVRVQTPTAAFRGPDATLFARPGIAHASARWLPDYSTTFTVAPRNLNGGH